MVQVARIRDRMLESEATQLSYHNDDAVGRSVEETLRLLKAFQWADSHAGEACPANWTPGGATVSVIHAQLLRFNHAGPFLQIKTDRLGAQEYFQKTFGEGL